jgi:UDP-N-acetylglucosamine acyltransferase
MIHPTAVISPQAQIDPSADIGPWCVIDGDVRIGARSRLVSGVTVLGRVTIGADNVFGAHAVIGGDPHDPRYRGEPTEVLIGERNRIFEFVTVDRGTTRRSGKTVIGSDNMVMAYVHVAHDTFIGDHCRITSHSGISGLCTIEDHAIISGMVGMQQGVRIGAYAFLSGHTAIIQDVLPYSIAYGTDCAAYLRGANLIGLKRHGFSREDIQTARRLLAAFQGRVRPFEQVLADVRAGFDGQHPIVRRVLDFAGTPSLRGVLR